MARKKPTIPDIIHLDPKNLKVFIMVNNQVETAEITDWYDDEGERCDPHAGPMCLAVHELGWFSIDLRDWVQELPN
jgi:hypothetical protein